MVEFAWPLHPSGDIITELIFDLLSSAYSQNKPYPIFFRDCQNTRGRLGIFSEADSELRYRLIWKTCRVLGFFKASCRIFGGDWAENMLIEVIPMLVDFASMDL